MNMINEILNTLGNTILSMLPEIAKMAYKISGIKDLLENSMLGAILGVSAGTAGIIVTIWAIIKFLIKHHSR